MFNPLAHILAQRRKRIVVLDREDQAKMIDDFAREHEDEALMRNLANQIRLNSLNEYGGLTNEEFDSIMKTHDLCGWSPKAHVAYQALLNSVR